MIRQLGLAAWVALLILATGERACAQAFPANPQVYSPYSRPHLSPYLSLLNPGTAATSYYNGVLKEIEYRNQLLRPLFAGQELLAAYDTSRIAAQQMYPDGTAQSAEEWINARLKETQLSPTGHTTGYLMAYPFYNLPNQRSFMPYNPNQVRPMR